MKMSYRTNRPGALELLARKALYCSAILGLGMAISMQSSIASEYGHSKSISFSPFSRVATMPVELDDEGDFDKAGTDAKAKAAAQALGFYLATVNEGTAGADEIFQGGDWILGGYEGTPDEPTDVAHAILGIPTPNPMMQKVNVLDLCNKNYASMALGVKPIAGDKKVVNGYSHTPTLPCEVAIYYDDQNIYVDMLDPSAIFKLFFSDVIFSDDMKDDDFAAAIQAMPPQVKAELKTIIYSALTAFDADLVQMDERMGPAYESIGDIIKVVKESPYQSPYKHIAYTKENGAIFSPEESALVAQTIINTMSIHGGVTPDGRLPGQHVTALEEQLTEDSSWRSARPTPLGLPGIKNVDGNVMKNFVIEACSPFFAKQALGTGAHHATALPCEIAVQIIDTDGDGLTETLVISYLDAHFMFGALFADITDEEKEAFAGVPTDVMSDLAAIVEYSLENDLGITLNPGERIKYNMLPGEKVGQFK
jgi:uncharacterized protein (DUF302 family)